jgi:hypothetical protein
MPLQLLLMPLLLTLLLLLLLLLLLRRCCCCCCCMFVSCRTMQTRRTRLVGVVSCGFQSEVLHAAKWGLEHT